MAHDNEVTATQERIFRIAMRNGLTLKAMSLDSGLPYNTLRSYAGSGCAAAEMPVGALRRLVGIIPDELLSLLLPEGRQIVKAPECINHDELSDHLRDWLSHKDHAHHPDSPDGREISASEDAELRVKFACISSARAA
jgi:hypothetical protein